MTKLLLVLLSVTALIAPVLLLDTGSAAALVSLKTVPVPEPLNLASYVRDRVSAIQLGKALFWDMQVSSDGVQACASCHFHAGADGRTKNQLNPGQNGGDSTFGNNNLGLPVGVKHSGLGPNVAIKRANFPFHFLSNPDEQGEPLQNPGNVLSDINDVMGSQGVVLKQFVDVQIGNPVDLGADTLLDPVFNLGGVNIRQVTGRNTPSNFNAVFNFANFWDGRANNIFNGNNPFGPADPTAHAFINLAGSLTPQIVRLRQSALGSQAVGPPLSDVEMSWRGRTWHKIGKKMLSLKPLNQQAVSATDSVLGALAAPTTGLQPAYSYAALIRKAFVPKLWGNTTQHLELANPLDPSSSLNPVPVAGRANAADTTQFSQMEANFSLFFGLAVQLYESTLIANDSRVDRFLEGAAGLTPEELRGMGTFNGAGGCAACHAGGETTDASVWPIQGVNPNTGIPLPLNKNPFAANELMFFSAGAAFYDTPFHNTAVRPGGAPLPENEDLGRGANSAFTAVDPLDPNNTFPIPLSWGSLAIWKLRPDLVGTSGTTVPVPGTLSPYIPPLPFGLSPTDTTPNDGRIANNGAFKTPHLRNIELTGPYMHNGGFSTLLQVVDFYTRGGDFPVTNTDNFDAGISPIGLLKGKITAFNPTNDLVSFLLAMTDQRVKEESAPFDHPELFLAIDGTAPVSPSGARAGFINANNVVTAGFQWVPPVGSAGRTAQGLLPIGAFLGVNHFLAQ